MLGPMQFAGARARGSHIEPQRVGCARLQQLSALSGRQRSRRSGIMRRAIGVARPWRFRFPLGDETGNLGAALETRIHKTQRRQSFKCLAIVGKTFRLPAHRSFPGDTQPCEIPINRILEFQPASGRVDVLDAQQEPSTCAAGQIEIQECRKGVAKMQIAIGARRKAKEGWRHYSRLVVTGLVPVSHVLQQGDKEIAMVRICLISATTALRW